MLRRRIKKNYYETHSATKINNYNQFLKNLDKYQNQVPLHIHIPVPVINDTEIKKNKSESATNTNTNTKDEMKEIQNTLDSIIQRASKQYLYGNMSNTTFHGLGKNDNIDYVSKIHNPNHDKDDDENANENDDLKKMYSLFGPSPLSKLATEVHDHDKSDTILCMNKYNMQKQKIELKYVNIDVQIETISDILKLVEDHKLDRTIKYNINMKALHNIKEPLNELNNMIGMSQLKRNIVDQILYFVQNLHLHKTSEEVKANNGDFIHSVVYGPPGTGKTEVAKLMGKIYSNLGILQKGTFKKVTRSDLIAGYLGQTAIKTKDVIKECLGGVLFIDEAYALGNEEKRDSFSKECIDTLCEALSDHKHELMVIIAGYENELNDCFFSYNPGLESRFTWRFKTDEYSGSDLYKIFLKKVKDIGWSVYDSESKNAEEHTKCICESWFKEKKTSFRFYGRDIETLLSKTKIAHSRRVFCKPENEKRMILLDDLNNGYEMFMQNENHKKQQQKMNQIITSMYV